MSDEGVIYESGDTPQADTGETDAGQGEKGGVSALFVRNNQESFDKAAARGRFKEESLKQNPNPNKEKDDKKKFYSMVQGADRVLIRIKAVFPFDFFPDQVIIDPNKINVIRKSFFLTEKLHSISVKAITDVYIQTAPFFASLHIMDNSVANNVIIVKYLWKKDAEIARRVIQGLIDAARQEVDLHSLDVDGIREKLIQTGKIATPHVSVKL